MTDKRKFTTEEAKWIGEQIGIDWNVYDLEQFKMGLEVELEHGIVNPVTNVTNDDLTMTAKIALAHLCEIPDYYTRLKKMEAEAESEMKARLPADK
ncbi:MAG: DUF5661 family protein [Ignavibacteria bacterium]